MSDDEPLDEGGAVAAAGQVHSVQVSGLPDGYEYGVTRYADVILQSSFPERLANIVHTLDVYRPHLDELIVGGGGRTVFTRRFDESLADQTENGVEVWGKKNITIQKTLGFDENPAQMSRVRGHEIDMFGVGSVDDPFPGIAVEMEWNNKDPFYDRDLNNFQALHREGAIAVGVIATRGPELQKLLGKLLGKYGQSTTHWNKLIPKVNLGGGGECPLFLIGIEPQRIDGVDRALRRAAAFDAAEEFKRNWRDQGYSSWAEARPIYDRLYEGAPPL